MRGVAAFGHVESCWRGSGGVNAVVVAVVFHSISLGTKDMVCFRDGDEFLRGVGVVGVEVRVVAFGEGVELFLNVGLGCGGRKAKRFVVVWEVLFPDCGCGERAV